MHITRILSSRRVFSVVAVLLTLPLCGCLALVAVAAVGGAGYVQYEKNEAFQDFDAELEPVWEAVLEVLEDQGHALASEYPHTSTEGVIHLEEDGVWVKVERTEEEYTRVRVRIDTFDTPEHRERAMSILVAIDEELR